MKEQIDNKNKNMNNLKQDELYKISDLFFKQPNILVAHQINTFNNFIDNYIYKLLKKDDHIFYSRTTSRYIYNYKFKFEDIYLKPPVLENDSKLMFPSDARTCNLSYTSKLIGTITQIQEKIDIVTQEKKEKIVGDKEYEYHITNIPIMVRSKYCSLNIKKDHDKKECKYDPGGYFIINGNEKFILSLEEMLKNKSFVYIKNDMNELIHTVQIESIPCCW